MYTYLIINGVEFGQHYSINASWVRHIGVGVVNECSIEFDQLIYGFVTNQCLPHKQYQIRNVDVYELRREGRGREWG